MFCGPSSSQPKLGQPPESQLNGGERNEGAQGFGKVLEVLGEPTASPERDEGALDPQRRDRTTKPFISLLRLAISMRSSGLFATAASTRQAL